MATRTITLTGRAPVRILEREWPILATASGDSYRGADPGRWNQALAQGECDTYILSVRQHADGRTLVYAVLRAAFIAWGAPAHGEGYRGGELLATGDDVAAAIRRVGEGAGIPDAVIRECVAHLPAVTI